MRDPEGGRSVEEGLDQWEEDGRCVCREVRKIINTAQCFFGDLQLFLYHFQAP